jgi:hypothetical protein
MEKLGYLHLAVLALVELFPDDWPADALRVGALLDISEAAAARALDDLEVAGHLTSALEPAH